MTGDAVNVAARLEQRAAPGEILIGDETHRLVRDAVEAEPSSPLAAEGKGRTGPRVAAARRARDVGRAPPRGARLADGRARASWQASARGSRAPSRTARCQLVTVLGSAGVGQVAAGRGVPRPVVGGRATVLTGPLPALRRGDHVLAGRSRSVEAGRTAGRLRSARDGRREGLCRAGARRAPALVVPARGAAARCRRRGRRRGDLLGDPPVLRGRRRERTARAGVRRRPLGRAHVPRPARAHRGLVARRRRSCSLCMARPELLDAGRPGAAGS